MLMLPQQRMPFLAWLQQKARLEKDETRLIMIQDWRRIKGK